VCRARAAAPQGVQVVMKTVPVRMLQGQAELAGQQRATRTQLQAAAIAGQRLRVRGVSPDATEAQEPLRVSTTHLGVKRVCWAIRCPSET
jgi:hypothetical protein